MSREGETRDRGFHFEQKVLRKEGPLKRYICVYRRGWRQIVPQEHVCLKILYLVWQLSRLVVPRNIPRRKAKKP